MLCACRVSCHFTPLLCSLTPLCCSFRTNRNFLRSQHVLLFLNGSKLEKKKRERNIENQLFLRGRRKYVGFVTARKSGTKLSPRIIYHPFLRAIFKPPGWLSQSSEIVCPTGAAGHFEISYPGACRPRAVPAQSSLLDSGLVCCLSGSVRSPQFL